MATQSSLTWPLAKRDHEEALLSDNKPPPEKRMRLSPPEVLGIKRGLEDSPIPGSPPPKRARVEDVAAQDEPEGGETREEQREVLATQQQRAASSSLTLSSSSSNLSPLNSSEVMTSLEFSQSQLGQTSGNDEIKEELTARIRRLEAEKKALEEELEETKHQNRKLKLKFLMDDFIKPDSASRPKNQKNGEEKEKEKTKEKAASVPPSICRSCASNATKTREAVTVSDGELYRQELELIRRPEPLVDSRMVRVKVVTTDLRKKEQPPSRPTPVKPVLNSANVVDLVDSSDEDDNDVNALFGATELLQVSSWLAGGGGEDYYANAVYRVPSASDGEEDNHDAFFYYNSAQHRAQEHQAMSTSRSKLHHYGFGAADLENEQRIHELLRFQTRPNSNNLRFPSPSHGLDFHLEAYLGEIGVGPTRLVRDQVDRLLRTSSWGSVTQDDEAGYQTAWLGDGNRYGIVRGLPLIEDVEMVYLDNHARPTGNCLWRALSYCLYATGAHWDLVKAEHLAYLFQALSDTAHPRHGLYARHINARFFDAASAPGVPRFRANLWQILHSPHAWTPAVALQVTADLYNVCVHTFTVHVASGRCAEVSVRGAYNARHIFLLFRDGNHYQPMVPNHFWTWEFRYPRLTARRTAGYAMAPKATSVKTTTQHPWRNEFTKEVPSPVPRSHGCQVEHMRELMDP